MTENNQDQLIGPYCVEKRLEQYGDEYTVIYLARHGSTGQRVYLTVFAPPSEAAAKAWAARFKTIKALQHPNIVTFSDGDMAADGALYVASRFYPPLLKVNTRLSRDALLAFSEQVSAALDYAHQHGVVHHHLTRIHIIRLPNGRYAVRGFELDASRTAMHDISSDNFPYQAQFNLADNPASAISLQTGTRADIVALSRLIYHILLGNQRRQLPLPLADVFRHAASFTSAEAFHEALAGALKTGSAPRRGQRVIIAALVITALATLAGIGLLLVNQVQFTATKKTPFIAVLPSATATWTVIPTRTPTFTITPTETFTPTDTVTPTDTLTPTATFTLTASLTNTALPSATPTPTFTLTFTPSVPPTATPTPTFTPTLDLALFYTNPCVSIVGDSVTHGGAVYEVPATGYVFAQTEPVSQFVEDRLKQVGITGIRGIDRGGPNTGISTTNHPSYFNTRAYQSLLKDYCHYTVIMPWINDITSNLSPNVAAPYHVQVLSNMVAALAADNPYGRYILLNYYTPAVSPFALNTWAAGFTPADIDLYNRLIAQECKIGKLSALPQVTCANTEDAFPDMGAAKVIKQTSREELLSIIIQPVNDQEAAFLSSYYASNPQGLILGDGVHLSKAGKTALAVYIVQVIQSLPPIPPPSIFLTPQG